MQRRKLAVRLLPLILLFVGQLNMPGNPGYDPDRPPDQVTVVWYNHGAPAAWRFPQSWDTVRAIRSLLPRPS